MRWLDTIFGAGGLVLGLLGLWGRRRSRARRTEAAYGRPAFTDINLDIKLTCDGKAASDSVHIKSSVNMHSDPRFGTNLD